MPIYEYRCRNDHVFEIFQSMSDDPVVACEQCGAPVERVFHPVAVHFKGSGFYNTDYKGKDKAAAAKGSDSGSGEKQSGSGSGERTKPESGSGGSGSESSGSDSGSATKAASSE